MIYDLLKLILMYQVPIVLRMRELSCGILPIPVYKCTSVKQNTRVPSRENGKKKKNTQAVQSHLKKKVI